MATPYPPGPKYLQPFTVMSRFRHDPIGLLTDLARDYGDMAHVRVGTMHLVALSHPDQIAEVLTEKGASFSKSPTLQRAKRFLGDGLLTSEEPLHRRQQRLMAGAFSPGKIRVYDDVVVDYTQRLSQQWKTGTALNLAEAVMQLTLSIIGKVLFGEDFESEGVAIEQDFTVALDRLRPFRAPLLGDPRFMEWFPGSKGWQFRRARGRLDSLVFRLIHQRRRHPDQEADMLSILLGSKDEEAKDDPGMIDLQARNEVVTLMLAGHETVANALAWTWYLLSQHPEIERKFHEEVDRVLGGALPTIDHQPLLVYTRMILTEAMRLFPPVWVIARQATQKCKVGNYDLPVGTVVSMSQYVVHHDRRWYPDPLRFDPLRWSADRELKRPKLSYFPFGSGSRHCIGERFAWMEATLILATLGQKWRMHLAPKARIDMDPGFTLRPKFGVPVILEDRSVSMNLPVTGTLSKTP
jgi:cytochrome P450